jgi:nicotinate-nucleotide--dimethylbenzimidazole phosphoribosyltransferase
MKITSATQSPLSSDYWQVPLLERHAATYIQQRITNKTKPPGSLGQLEQLATSIALIQSQAQNQINIEQITIEKPCVLIFAADHGIATHPISIAPQAVTEQMVHNFLAGGAAINCFCTALDVELKVIDAGVLSHIISDNPKFTSSSVAPGTQDFSVQPAMTKAQVTEALVHGENVAKQHIHSGSNVLAFGEMGIGNTTSASALLSALYALPANQTVGRGTGINDQQLINKQALIDKGLARISSVYGQGCLHALAALQELGGFEIAQIVGAMLATAKAQKCIVVDGFIVSVAALIATHIDQNCRQYMIFAHSSAEQAHQLVLEKLQAKPLLDLELRLGEGTGAALAIPLIRAAAEFYNNMATFDSAAIELA